MSDSKIQLKVGVVEFSGEGDSQWLSLQFDKILAKIPQFLQPEKGWTPVKMPDFSGFAGTGSGAGGSVPDPLSGSSPSGSNPNAIGNANSSGGPAAFG
jgi:hypothetical protein